MLNNRLVHVHQLSFSSFKVIPNVQVHIIGFPIAVTVSSEHILVKGPINTHSCNGKTKYITVTILHVYTYPNTFNLYKIFPIKF